MSTMDTSSLADQIEAMKDDPDAWGDPTPDAPPRRSERRARATVVSVRLTAEELAKVQAYAERRHLSLSGALRTATLEAEEASSRVVPHPRWTTSQTSNSNGGEELIFRDIQSNLQSRLD
ncbi:MAG: hypothetical protein JO115_06055 [Pseudonocardiales bacterium]|nr:hypothetical protein [Pseudonocardiales bacterium]